MILNQDQDPSQVVVIDTRSIDHPKEVAPEAQNAPKRDQAKEERDPILETESIIEAVVEVEVDE